MSILGVCQCQKDLCQSHRELALIVIFDPQSSVRLLSSTGHDLQETASVTVYRHTEGGAKPCGGGASLRYVCDLPQEVAEYLLANSDCLSPQSHLEVLRRVSAAPGEGDREGDMSAGPGKEHSLGQTDQEEEGVSGGRPRPDPQIECHLREMDERITQAVANLNYPLEWSGKASQPREGNQPYYLGFLYRAFPVLLWKSPMTSVVGYVSCVLWLVGNLTLNGLFWSSSSKCTVLSFPDDFRYLRT